MTKPKIILKPRYAYVNKKVTEFILNMGINSLPVDPLNLIAKNAWTLRTYRFYAKKHKVPSALVAEVCGSEDAFTIYRNGIYSIAYNDRIRSLGRIRFTLMHEVGHIYLRHLEEFDKTILSRGGLSDKEYKTLETEADTFASEVLAPYEVMLAMGLENYQLIQRACGLSTQAAKVKASRIFDLKTSWAIYEYDSPIIKRFYNFIFQKQCQRCGAKLVIEKAKFCPICGGKLKWGEGTVIYNDGYKLDEKSRAIQCPRCENDELSEYGDYCKICGVDLVNKCADKWGENDYGEDYLVQNSCGMLAEGNARYCINCGNPTTYFLRGLLSPWHEVQESIKQKQSTNKVIAVNKEIASTKDDDDIPF